MSNQLNVTSIILSGQNINSIITGVSGALQTQIGQGVNLNGLMSTGSANLTYLVTGASGNFYLSNNPNNFSTSGYVQLVSGNLQNQITSTSPSGNFVDLVSNQLISGTKMFFSGIGFNFISGMNSNGTFNIIDHNGLRAADMGGRQLYSFSGFTDAGIALSTVDWHNCVLTNNILNNGESQNSALNWHSRQLLDANVVNLVSADWQVRQCYDSGSNLSLDWANRIYSGSWIVNGSGINTITASGQFTGYLQVNVTNTNSGQNASSDLVCTSNNGSETGHYVDLGINSSTYTGAYIGYTGDSYLFSQGNNFYIGNAVSGQNLYLFAGNQPISGNNVGLTIQQNKIGINNPNPKFQLDVSGSIGCSGLTATNYFSKINTQSANYNISLTDSTIFFTGSVAGTLTGTLPSASSYAGGFYNIKNISNVTTILVTGTNSIDNSGSFSLTPLRGIELQSNGLAWWIMTLT